MNSIEKFQMKNIEPFNLVTLSIDNFYLDKKVNK